ncbi:MAG: hypothetical protein EON58_15440 [Alphaproteobacteria bacterium]|nr:MAG: hypothetical protein EON58_15440 [Alphaproteobacteria bacterium]
MSNIETNNNISVRTPALDLSRVQLVIGLVFVIGTPLLSAVGTFYSVTNAISNQQIQISKLDNRIGNVEDSAGGW